MRGLRDWLPPLGIMILRFIHIIIHLSSSPFLSQSDRPLQGPPIHLLMDIWVLYSFWLLWAKLLQTFTLNMGLRVHIRFPFSRVNTRKIIAGSYGKCVLNFIWSCQAAFQSGDAILHSHQFMGVLGALMFLPPLGTLNLSRSGVCSHV